MNIKQNSTSKIELKYNKVFNGKFFYSVKEFSNILNMAHIFSYWEEDDYPNIMLNTLQAYGPYKLQRKGAVITAKLYIQFKGSVIDNNATYPVLQNASVRNPTYEELFKLEFKERWNGSYRNRTLGGVYYDKFGKDSSVTFSADLIKVSNNNYTLPAIINVDGSIPQQDSYGKITSKDMVSHITRQKTWGGNFIGEMFMFRFYAKKGDKSITQAYDDYDFEYTVAHEFGHFFGLGDAYTPPFPNTVEVPESTWLMGDIMKQNGPANSNNIEMLFEAVKKNKWQDFFKSEVVRLR
jgi:hypothetical protein